MTTGSSASFTEFDRCLACGGADLRSYLNLGEMPLANAFAPSGVALPVFPLGLTVCGSCYHSQNLGAVDPVVLYTDYPYVSGTSASLRQYFSDFVMRVEEDMRESISVGATPAARLRVLDIACNDGTLLREFSSRGHVAWGVDPATNLGTPERRDSALVVTGFWGDEAVATEVEGYGPFDVIVAMNVLGHVADPLAFLQLAKRVLAPGGRIYVQTSQAYMVANCEFDTVYHEHLSFFTPKSFAALATRAGLIQHRMSVVEVHGGSFLVELIDGWPAGETDGHSVTYLSPTPGLYDLATYDGFQQRVRDTLDLTRKALQAYGAGRRIVGYGAAAKAMTFFNAHCGAAIKARLGRAEGCVLDYFVDDNPLKLHKLCPGLGIPVLAPAVLAEEPHPLLVVIGAWNMADEIIARVKAIRPGKCDLFLTYFPTLNVRG